MAAKKRCPRTVTTTFRVSLYVWYNGIIIIIIIY